MSTELIVALIKANIVLGVLLTNTILLIWFERKLVAGMQSRVGPDRAGPFGILQTVADAIKLMLKEQILPLKADRAMYLLAPIVALVPSFLIFMIIPLGPNLNIEFGGENYIVEFVGADLNVGVLYFLALSSIAVYSVVLAGWSSGSKYPLLGGVRASAQMISYEAAMGLALVPVILYSGSLSLVDIVDSQSGNLSSSIPILNSIVSFIPKWNVFPQFVAFGIFFIAAVAEVNRAPFDLVEAEQELVGGFHTEYSGFRFAMFFLAEYINMFNMCAITATFFLGGWLGPTFENFLPPFLSSIMPIIWLGVKTFSLLFIFVWIRATLPRLRYDQLMELGWKRLIPASLVWLILSAVVLGLREFGLPWS
ncbi:MAG: NADH-quinone oxidoreductase subunit NuoH [Candidatus Actinomarina sp.]|jgi:NADH-quinone oxidoreductase subunit H|tara:strand:- start:13815 stop:14912 length:1098 start_codon:yes stop_codon:yes gene_type:complete